MVSLELPAMFLFFLIVGILLLRDRKKIEFHAGLVIRRWKRGLEFIDNLVEKHARLIRISGYIAILMGVLVCIGGFGYLIYFTIFLRQQAFGLVLPTAGGYKYPGPVIGVPFWYWLIAIFIILFSHETMHAIFARASKVTLKNYGIMLFLVLPIGAFVEPSTKMVEKLKTSKKLPFFASGSFANFLIALLFFLLILVIYGLLKSPVSGAFIEDKGVFFNETLKGYPLYDANITGTGIVTAIDGVKIKTSEELSKFLNNTNPGEEIKIVINGSTYNLTTVARPDNQTGSFIGLSSPMTIFSFKGWMLVIYNLFNWLVILNLGIGVANLLPWRPFDGGLMAQEILTKIFKKNGQTIANALMIITYFLVLFNLFGFRIINAIIH
jgi:membrane-associated protease RseP (regulator of RpoE activity)